MHLAYVLLQPVAHLQQQNEVGVPAAASEQLVYTCASGSPFARTWTEAAARLLASTYLSRAVT